MILTVALLAAMSGAQTASLGPWPSAPLTVSLRRMRYTGRCQPGPAQCDNKGNTCLVRSRGPV